MKIILISNTSWNLFNFRKELIDFLNKKNDIFLVAPKDEYYSKLKKNYKIFNWNVKATSTNLINEINAIKSLYKIIDKIRPDVVLSFTIKPNIYVNLLKFRFKYKVISNISGLGKTFINKGIFFFFISLLYILIIQRSNYIFFQNKHDLEFFRKKKYFNNKNVSVIPGSGVNLNYFSNSKYNLFEINKKKYYFLFIGRFEKEKGIYEYCEASKLLKKENSKLNFYAISPNDKNIENFQKKYIHIAFLKRTDNIKQILLNTRIVVLPSYREGNPRSLIEACSMSIPIITTDVPGCNEVVINNYNGVLCNKKSIKSLLEKLKIFSTIDTKDLFRMSQNSRKHAIAKYDINFVVKKYHDVIKNL